MFIFKTFFLYLDWIFYFVFITKKANANNFFLQFDECLQYLMDILCFQNQVSLQNLCQLLYFLLYNDLQDLNI